AVVGLRRAVALSVVRRVGAEPARCLLELPLAARAIPTARVVPGDRNVHESLEEVPLCRGRRPPLVLELFVSLEVGAFSHQLQPSGERHGARLSASADGASVAAWPRSCSLGSIFSSAGNSTACLRRTGW